MKVPVRSNSIASELDTFWHVLSGKSSGPDCANLLNSRLSAAVLAGVALLIPALACAEQFGSDPADYLTARENTRTCFDETLSPQLRIKACNYMLDKVSLTRSQSSMTYLARAESEEQAADERAALLDLQAAAKKNPSSSLPWVALGDFYARRSEFSAALAAYGEGIKVTHLDAVLYDDHGVALESLGRHDEAIADFTQALLLDPSDRSAYSNRATAYLATNHQDLAILDLNEVLKASPGNGRAFYDRGTAYERTGKIDQATADYRAAARLLPEFAPSYQALGRLLRDSAPEEALAAMNEAIRINPNSSVRSTRAALYLAQHQPEQALSDFNFVIAHGLADSFTYANRGVAKATLANYTGAIEDFSASIDLAPVSAVYTNRGSAFLELGRMDDALKDYNAALQLDPNNTLALMGRANANYVAKRAKESLADYSRVIEMDASNGLAYFKRGNLHLDRKEFSAALSDYSESLKINPGQAEVLYNRSIAAGRLRHFDQALQDQRLATEADAHRPRAVRAELTVTQSDPTAGANAVTAPGISFGSPRAAPAESADDDQVTVSGHRHPKDKRTCSSDVVLGSRVEKKVVCLTPAQKEAQQRDTQRFIDGTQRAGAASQNQNPLNVGGLAGE